MKKLKLIIERHDGLIWGRIVDIGFSLPPTAGENMSDVISNMKGVIKYYQDNEGKDDPDWSGIAADKVEFDIRYDLQGFLKNMDFLNLNVVARRGGINQSLLRQYSSGVKFPTEKQAKKLEAIIHELAKEMEQFSIYK